MKMRKKKHMKNLSVSPTLQIDNFDELIERARKYLEDSRWRFAAKMVDKKFEREQGVVYGEGF